MSDKCKTLIMTQLAPEVYGEDGVCVDEFLAAAPPPLEFHQVAVEANDTSGMGDVVAGAVGSVQRSLELARRLAAIVYVEVAGGPIEILTCNRAMATAWCSLIDAFLNPVAEKSGGRMLVEEATAATFEFVSMSAAVHWAVGVQSVLENCGDEIVPDGVRLRINIGVGEIDDAMDLRQGPDLNDLALTRCLGRPGEILITGLALDYIKADLKLSVAQVDRAEAETPWGQNLQLYNLNWRN